MLFDNMISLFSVLIVINLIVKHQFQEIDDSFKCVSDNKTIFLDYRCDGTNNCDDGSDEDNCSCPQGQFRGSSGYCISDLIEFVAQRFCPMVNGKIVCAVDCKPDEFRCSSTKCIPKTKCCDGNSDCLYSIDEWTKDCLANKKVLQHGKRIQCPHDELYCYTKQVDADGYHCAPNYGECFHAHECEIDGCKFDNPCPTDQFRCYDAPCLDKKYLCDGKWNCYAGVDESPIGCNFKARASSNLQVANLSTARVIAVYFFVVVIVVAISLQIFRVRRKIRSRVNEQLHKLNKKSPERSPSVERTKSQEVEAPKSNELKVSKSKELGASKSNELKVVKSNEAKSLKSNELKAPKSSEVKPPSITEPKSKQELGLSRSKSSSGSK